MHKSILLVLVLQLSCVVVSKASEKEARQTINWKPNFEKRISETVSLRTFNFEGAKYDENFMPYLEIKQVLSSASIDLRVQLVGIVTEPVTDINLIRNLNTLGNDFKVTTQVQTRKKRYEGNISILPIRKSGTGGYERLVSFNLNIQQVPVPARIAATRNYAPTSVLATGDWYKLAIIQTGIYKIDYNFLKKLGVDVESVNPADIQLYGNGGGMLPMLNSTFRYDDLQQNSIEVVDGGDGHFDEQDYILFYGTAQTRWTYNASTRQFNHQVNEYADSTYYFLTTSSGNLSKRIQLQSSGSVANTTVTTFDDYIYHEADLYNFLKSGREWYGEAMDNLSNTISISNSISNLSTNDTIFFRSNLAGRATSGGSNSLTANINGNLASQSFSIVGAGNLDPYFSSVNINKNLFSSSPILTVTFTLNSTDPAAQGWLNYYELNFRRNLNMSNAGNQFSFRDKNSVGPGMISEFQISGTTAAHRVWEVTDPLNPVNQTLNFSGSVSSFVLPTDNLREFVVFSGQQYFNPIAIAPVANQNLHALSHSDMLIITNSLFLPEAFDLAELHRTHDNLSVVVATTQQIFNEFSSGAQDVSAIRDFIKMFYDRATTQSEMPRFALLMGDASYDNKSRISGNTNFVTSYQSASSSSLITSYITDDFFGLLDDNEGEWSGGDLLDISIGRIPVKSSAEASSVVAKIKRYVMGEGASVANPTMGSWRNIVSFVADDEDGNIHLKQADTLANRVAKNFPMLNIDKIYLDSYNQEARPGGDRYPDAQSAIIDRVERGTLLITYIGHGGELGWAHERVLEVDDINSWSNTNKLAAFLTATCEFTRVDDPGRTSAGELVFLNPAGGAICMFTTSRLAFSNSNYNLCQAFFNHVFDKSSGQYLTCGEIFEQTKVDYSDPYVRNFILLGDPAVRMAFPEFNVKTNTINGIDINLQIDTIKALSKIVITGEVQDHSGNKMTGFNGIVYPTIYDKIQTLSTIGNDRLKDPTAIPQPFKLQKNVIFNGKVSVVNGEFSFTFVVPKDISFPFGKGKLSYYAQNGQIDAAGFDTSVVVGGLSNNIPPDDLGPQVKLYINDEKFVRGGLTDKDPVLYAVITDSSGLNTVGTGIGHDITAELDSKTEKKYVLNNYYENDLDSYQSGKVRYQFKDLAPGPHSVVLKVWDVYNNSSLATTDFIVSESAKLALDHVLNYPNPFTTHTTFMFEHNRPYVQLDVQVQIFTVSGKLIKTITDRITTEGYRSDRMEWNGLDDFGDKIGRGVYVYRLRVKTNDGEYADKFEKLVILR